MQYRHGFFSRHQLVKGMLRIWRCSRGTILYQLLFSFFCLSLLFLWLFPYVVVWQQQLQKQEIHHFLEREALYLSWYLGELIRRGESVALISGGMVVCETPARCIQVERYTNQYRGSGQLQMLRKRVNWQGHSVLSYYVSDFTVQIEGRMVQVQLELQRSGLTIRRHFSMGLRRDGAAG